MLFLRAVLAYYSTLCVIREVPESWLEKSFLDRRAASTAEEIPAKLALAVDANQSIDANVVTPFHNK